MFHLLHSSRSWRALSLLIFGLLLSLPVRAGEGDDPLSHADEGLSAHPTPPTTRLWTRTVGMPWLTGTP